MIEKGSAYLPRPYRILLQLADMLHALRDDRADVVVGERIKHAFPLAPALDELAALEDPQLVGDGRLRHPQRLGPLKLYQKVKAMESYSESSRYVDMIDEYIARVAE